jgi:RNA recognition motif-containing protein
MKLFVRNLARDVTDLELRAAFEPFGTLSSVEVVKDKFGGGGQGIRFCRNARQSPGRGGNRRAARETLQRSVNERHRGPSAGRAQTKSRRESRWGPAFVVGVNYPLVGVHAAGELSYL